MSASADVSSSTARAAARHAPISPVWIAIALGLAAAALSAIRSPDVSFWTDEAITITAADRTWPELWAMLGNVDAVHGAYYAVMKLWLDAVGVNEFTLRLPSALSVGVAVAFTFLLGRMLRTGRFGILAAIVLMVLPRATWAGVEGRSWALTIAFVAMMSWLLVLGIRTRRTSVFVAYAVVSAVGGVVNIYVLLLVAAHAITVLLTARRRDVVLRFAPAATAAILAALPTVLLARSQEAQLGVSGDRNPVTIARKIVVNMLFLGETPSAAAVPPWLTVAWSTGAIVLAAVGWALIVVAVWPDRSGAASHGRRETVALALPWLVLPVTLVAAYAVLIGPIFQPRYFSFVAPAGALLIATGLTRLSRRPLTVFAVAVMVLAIAPVYTSQRVAYAKAGTDWSTASEVIASRAQPGDAVYFTPRFIPTGDTVGWTARRISYGYPDPFASLDDLTLRGSGAETADLDGESALLADSSEELLDHAAVWVLYGKGYPASLVQQDHALLESAGFTVADTWEGPRTVIKKYIKGGDG